MRFPLVSIITPAYNQGKFIEKTILSVKHQDYPYIEHLVIDGGSTDNTLDVLHKYSDVVRWISEPDKGFADAVNKGIRMSSGDILAIQNSDDTYHDRSAIRKAVDAFIGNPTAGVIFGDSAIIDENNKLLNYGERAYQGYNFSAFLCSEFSFPQSSAFIRRSALEAINGKLDTDVDWCADFDLFIRIGLRFPLIYIPEVLANYRVSAKHRNARLSYAFLNPRDRRRVLKKVFSSHDLPPEIQRLKGKAYAGTYLVEASRLCSFGLMKEAVKCIITAIRLYPSYLFNQRLFQINRNMFYKYLELILGKKMFNSLIKMKHSIQKRNVREEEPQSYMWWK